MPNKRHTARVVTRRGLLAGAGVAAGATLFAATGAAATQAAMQAPPSLGTIKETSPHYGPIVLRYFALDMEGSNWEKGIGEEIIKEFSEEHVIPRVNVLPMKSDEIHNRLMTAVAAGEPPDVAFVDSHQAKELGLIGIAISVLPWIKATGMETEDYWQEAFLDLAHEGYRIADSTYGGFLFGLPWAPTVTTFFYNQDVFEEVSHGPVFVEPNVHPHKSPADWDELIEATTLTHTKRGEKSARLGFWHGDSSLAWWLVPYWQQGGQLLSADGLTSTLDNEKLARAFALTRRLLDLQGGLDAIYTFKDDEPHQALFASGRCAMWTDGIEAIRSPAWAEAFAELNLGVASYPVAPGGSPAAFRGGGAHVLPEAYELDYAFLFLEWLFKESNDLRFNDVRGSLPARRAGNPRHSRAHGQVYLEERKDHFERAGGRQRAGAAGAGRGAEEYIDTQVP